MRITVSVDDGLMAMAEELTGLRERPTLIDEALRALVARESARRLIALGGSQPELQPVPRRRDDPC